MDVRPNKIPPLVAAAAVSVIVASAVGVAAVTGYLPRAASSPAEIAASSSATGGADRDAPRSPAARTRGATSSVAVQPQAVAATCADCAVIEDIRAVQVSGNASGVGAAAGGITGALIGNQIGHGSGRTLATIAGAAGGAFAGNSIEKNLNKQLVHRVTLRMADGTTRVLTLQQAPAFAIGDRVRVRDGRTLEKA